MKIHLLVLPLVALLSACAGAQPKPATVTAPQSSVDPAAQALIERVMATYKDASGIRYRVSNRLDDKDQGMGNLAFSRPKLLNIERQNGKDTVRLLLDGNDFYLVQDASYRKEHVPPSVGTSAVGTTMLFGGLGGTSGQFIGEMLDGKNPLDISDRLYSKAPFQNYKRNTVFLGPRVVDGDVPSGIQSTFSFDTPQSGGKVSTITEQITAWFGGSPLSLRRVQTHITQDGKTSTLIEKITDQQISPTFADDAFTFNDTGLKPAPEDNLLDARLTVGAAPLPFSVKALDGKTISPKTYKGKVLLLDFWATWCAPCVEALPELKDAYDKYHSKGLEVVSISLDEDKSALTSFIKTNKMVWPQVFDGKGWQSSVPSAYGVQAAPLMLVIGRDGKIAALIPPSIITAINPRGDIDAAVKAALAAS